MFRGETSGGVAAGRAAGGGQSGKVWTSRTRGPISQSSPRPYKCVYDAAFAKLAAAAEIAWLPGSPQYQTVSTCINAAPTRNGITTSVFSQGGG
eukprot:354083-Chlamydomonas_euryale.AAC.9